MPKQFQRISGKNLDLVKICLSFTFLIFSALFSSLSAQLFGLPHQERYTISSGLSNNSITDIQQDAEGNLWIGTADGLNVFDGYSFISFHPDQSDSSSISDSFISALELDPNSKLWIATQKGGINYFNDSLEDFFSLPLSNYDQRQTDFFITHGQSLYLDDPKHIWIGSDKGTVKIEGKSGKGELGFLNPEYLSYSFLSDQQGGIWIGTSGGLLRASFQDKKAKSVKGLSVEKSGEVLALAYDSRGNLLVGAKEGLFIKQGEQWNEIMKDEAQGSSFSNINALLLDRQGRIWIAGQDGLEILDEKSLKTNPTERRVLEQNKLQNENIHCLFLDREDNLWIGTANNGLIRLFLSEKHFPLFRKNLEPNEGGAPENTIRSIWADTDSKIWLGSYGAGLFLFDRKKLTYQNFTSNNKAYTLSGNQVSKIYRDRRNDLWVGTWGDGLNKVEEYNGGLRFIPQKLYEAEDPGRTNLSKIHQILEDEFDNLWIGTNGGLFRKTKNSNKFENVSMLFDIPDQSINFVMEDVQGNWWIGTWNGLFLFDSVQMEKIKQKRTLELQKPAASYYFERDNPEGLSNNRITTIFEDSRSRIWIGTYGGGLNLWIPEKGTKGKFRSFSDKNGLPNNVVFGIMEDDLGKLWLSTNNGLVLFDPEALTFRTYNEDDGLQSNQFYFGAYARTPSGEMIFGGTNGFNIFDPILFSAEEEIPGAVQLRNFFIRGEKIEPGQVLDGEVLLSESLSRLKKIELQPNDNSFRIDFISPGINYSQKVKYAFRLIGLTEKWQHASFPNLNAVYSNLFEGNYTFEVRASLDGQNWSEIKRLSLEVLPHWYRTWWAYLIFGLLFLLFLGIIAKLSFIYSNLHNKLKLEKLSRQQEAEINSMRLWFFTYISHEFRTPLSLIISPLTEILNKLNLDPDLRKKLSLTYKNSQRLLRLVNQILNFRMINSGKLKLRVSEQDLVFFVHEIYMSFASLADERWIDYQFESSKHRIPLFFDIEKMELILYNLIGNAFKYSKDGGQIIVRIKEAKESVIISVKDRGIGIPEAEKVNIFEPFSRVSDTREIGSGIGLTICRDLSELHKGKIWVESAEGKGSTFFAEFQKGKSHFSPTEILSKSKPITLSPVPQGLEREVLKDTNTDLIFPEMAGKDRLKMLIVEDNLEMRRYMANHFSSAFHLYEAPNGKEGLDLAKKKNPDIIISDVMMPEMDGISMVKRLKTDSKTQHIPVILLSSRTAMSQQLEGLEKGAFEYLTKPVNIHILQAKVRSIIENVRVMRSRYKNESILPIDEKGNNLDEKFLLEAAQVIEKNLNNTKFNAAVFAEQMGMSRSGLYKRLQGQTGKSTTEFIRFVRIKHAEKLLREGNLNISQAAFKVGFNDLKYFRKCFKEEFGLSPSKYLSQENLR
ncbi:MAG: two-component regulator propeller domain-containing protein [Bacteroidota bacterium]